MYELLYILSYFYYYTLSSNNQALLAAISAVGARQAQCASQASVINSSGLNAHVGRGSGAKVKA